MKTIMQKLRGSFRRLLIEEDGIGSVEMILILVVLIGIVIIFKKQITDLANNIWKTITQKSGNITK